MAEDKYSEKVSVNINTSTLSMIDLLVDHGYFSNRSDFINQALRGELDKYRSTIDRVIEEKRAGGDAETKSFFIGISSLDKAYFKSVKKAGKKVTLTGYGVLIINEDVSDELIFETVAAIKVRGKLKCSEAVRKYYA